MDSIQYVGERLMPGSIGHFAILLGFVASLVATIGYYFATKERNDRTFESWRNIGRVSYLVHGAAVFTVIGVLFYVMINKYYEYQYVWAHVSEDLPFKYIFAAFWEGQEGSFLLWMFWHIVLGILLIFSAEKWEAPTMSVLALIELFINSMLLGIYIGGGEDAIKIGSNPTLLLRDVMDAPIFANAEYVNLIKGNGLNPLLQNYWMTIHPPTLFLGFASTSIPFCFAIAGLWLKEHSEWYKAAMPWALFSASILGAGILMGGAWAYEALSFGGYWAWDPVENMSLVPWLVLLAGIHTNLIAKNTGHSIRSTYVFYILTFVLILYSTFLTRSGVLGETSVHAFTEMGLEWQLIAFIITFLGIGGVLLALRYKQIPAPTKEEPTASKEFWMFIGTLVLLFSALIITASTSLPVYNKIVAFFKPGFIGRVITDAVPHYNKYQLWIAVFIGVLSGFTQFLRFREANWKSQMRRFWVHLSIALVLSFMLTWLTMRWIQVTAWQYKLLLFAGIFTVITNLDYIISYLRGNLKVAGSAIAHIGFGLMIVGIMASGLNKKYISSNPFMMDGLIEGADEDIFKRNILLFKNSTMLMSGYEVTYTQDTMENFTRTYTVNYKRRDEKGKVIEEFDLHPNILYDKSFTKIAASNPSTKKYWNKDVFTHITTLPQVEIDMEFRRKREDSLNYKLYQLPLATVFSFLDTVPIKDRDTFTLKNYQISVESIDRHPSHPDYQPVPGDIAVGATIRVQRDDEDSTFLVKPLIVLRGQLLYAYPVQINPLSTKIRLHASIFDQIMVPEDKLPYQEFNVKQGETITLGNLGIRFASIVTNPTHPSYQRQEGDVAAGMNLVITAKDGNTYQALPVFIIRNNQIFGFKDEVEALGLHIRFAGVDPDKETAQLFIAQAPINKTPAVPLEIATDSFRSDYIVLEAIEFPGINYFWIGTSLMMIGLTISMLHRIRNK